jgi:hypothetical protein
MNAERSSDTVPELESLSLSDYELELCRRVSRSPESEPPVRQMATLALEMHRGAGLPLGVVSERTKVPIGTLRGVLRIHKVTRLQGILGMRAELPARLGDCRYVRLSATEADFCRGVIESGKGARGRIRRAAALLLLNEGKPKAVVANQAGLCQRSIDRLFDRVEAVGVQGAVNDAERPGRPERYPKREFVPLIRSIVSQLEQSSSQWTLGNLRQVLVRQRPEAATMSAPTLRSLVMAAGFRHGLTDRGIGPSSELR